MKLSDLARRLLNPLGGDRLDHPQRRLRLNLRRVELIAAFELCSALYEGIFRFQRSIPGMLTFCIAFGTINLISRSWRVTASGTPPPRCAACPRPSSSAFS